MKSLNFLQSDLVGCNMAGQEMSIQVENIKERTHSLLAIVDISAVQSSAQTFNHNAILFIDASNNA